MILVSRISVESPLRRGGISIGYRSLLSYHEYQQEGCDYILRARQVQEERRDYCSPVHSGPVHAGRARTDVAATARRPARKRKSLCELLELIAEDRLKECLKECLKDLSLKYTN